MALFIIHIKTNSRKELVEVLNDRELKVSVSAPPVDGAANIRLIELLAKHFGVARSRCVLTKGFKSKMKWVEIDLD